LEYRREYLKLVAFVTRYGRVGWNDVMKMRVRLLKEFASVLRELIDEERASSSTSTME
jgi:hypothetical protein